MENNQVLPAACSDEMKSIYEDAHKLCRAFPKVPLLNIIYVLKDLPEENRLINFILRYFIVNHVSSDQMDTFNNEVDIIHNLLPKYPKIDIAAELSKVPNITNRVEYVLKQYVNNISSPLRSNSSYSEDNNEDSHSLESRSLTEYNDIQQPSISMSSSEEVKALNDIVCLASQVSSISTEIYELNEEENSFEGQLSRKFKCVLNK